MHSLERNLIERDYKIPALHDYEEYGYQEEEIIGLKEWYKDYMRCNVKKEDGTYIGLNEVVYTLTPPAESDFKNALQVEFSQEPQNIFEEIKIVFNMF